MKRDVVAVVMPMISVDSVENARDFYVGKLGFTHKMGMLGKDGKLDFVTVVLGGARVMLLRPVEKREGSGPSETRRPIDIYMQVEDVEKHFELVTGNGVKPTSPLTKQWWGDLTFTLLDPYGYQIWFFQNVGEPKPPAGAKLV